MRTALLLALSCMLTLGCKPSTPAPKDPDLKPAPQAATIGNIRNLHIAGDLYLSGQPTENDYALLETRGVKTVIDLRHDNEPRGFDERIVAGRHHGMTIIYLPWDGPDEITDQMLDQVRGSLHTAERPILLKCASANRVGAVWLAYRVLNEGIAIDQATAEAKQVGMRTPVYETKVLDYIYRQHADHKTP